MQDSAAGVVRGMCVYVCRFVVCQYVCDACVSYLLPTLLLHHVSVEWEVFQLGGF